MRAARARWGITPLLAAPLGAWALGLGNLEVRSALNQPLDAQIPLVATPQELERLRVSLASIETFQARGLDRPGFLANLEFRVITRNGQSYIHVTSRQPINEPLVTLIVEATWAAGSQQRMYDMLLDPPVFLPSGPMPAAAPQQPAQPSVAAGPVTRPQPQPQPAQPVPQAATPPQQPAQQQAAPATPPRTAPATPVPRAASAAAPGSYGPVQRSETLWAIAERFRPSGVTMNQMMLAIFEANPQAFAGNMNLLQAGATLSIPEEAALRARTATDATAEVQRQVDVWQGRTPATPAPAPRLVLVPPRETVDAPPAPQPAVAAADPPAESEARASPATPPATASTTPDERPVDVTSTALSELQAAAAADTPAVPADEPSDAGLAADDIFVDTEEAEPADAVEAAPAAAATTPPAATTATTQPAPAAEPSLLDNVMTVVMKPTTWFAVAGAIVVLLAAGFVMRRRNRDADDVTGRWETLQAEVDEEAREATQRMRGVAPAADDDEVEAPRAGRAAAGEDSPAQRGGRAAAGTAAAAGFAAATAAKAPNTDETLSNQTVINLDQADAIAEADFHVAYGLYDQAADLLTKALKSAPDRRDLKIKLLEVYFMWGNKEAFLAGARDLQAEIGTSADADWNKVVIMGKQLCPDEQLFVSGGGSDAGVDLDLAGGDAPLDFAFEDSSSAGLDFELEEPASVDDDALTLESSGVFDSDEAPTLAKSGLYDGPSAAKPGHDDSLDIGERTAAGLEAALFTDDDDEEETAAAASLPDDLSVTQEAATVERRAHDWQQVGDAPTVETPTIEALGPDAPTVESPTFDEIGHDAPTVESPSFDTIEHDAPTVESPRFDARTVEAPTIDAPFDEADDDPDSATALVPATEATVEQPALKASGGVDSTAEINLDDLGLDVSDLEDLPGDLGERAIGDDDDTGQTLGIQADDELLSATGVTQVLRADFGKDDDDFEARETAVLEDDALGDRDDSLVGTAVMTGRHDLDASTGDSQLVKALGTGDDIDLNLDDFSAALHGGDTVEQPRSFGTDVFGGGDTPVDLDVGFDVRGDNDGGEPLDAQTMTEVGTKLDLARAYIDMGDPEGARSILEEVLDEGDPGQRREAQGLIDALSA